jgi:HlyD family secretion protein
MLQKADVAEVLKAAGRREKRGHLLRLTIIATLVIVAVAGAIALWLILRGGGVVSYATAPVSRGDIAVLLTATGTLEPRQQVSVSSVVTGTISSVDVDYNQPVIKGQILARLDLRSFDLQLRRAVALVDAQAASRDAAAASVTDTEASLRRVGQLALREVVSIEQVELATTALQRAKANLAAADAQLKAAQADLASARDDYRKAAITAPIDGVILDVNAEIGQAINAGSLGISLFTIASDLRRLELVVDIDEADIGQVEVGDEVVFSVEAMPDRRLSGRVRQVRAGPTVSNGITTYKAVISVDNDSLQLRPGMTATADITTARATNVLMVPSAALRFNPDSAKSATSTTAVELPRVYVLRDGVLSAIEVTTGLSDGQRTQVAADGLSAGDAVVTGRKGR